MLMGMEFPFEGMEYSGISAVVAQHRTYQEPLEQVSSVLSKLYLSGAII